MRVNSSDGPLASGFSMSPFSHEDVGYTGCLPSFEHLLDRAADVFGIDSGYWDIWGRYHTTPVATRQAILRALGVDADSSEGLERSLASLAHREWDRPLPPVVVADAGAP